MAKEPHEYWDDYCEEEEKYRRRLPICAKCGNRITSDLCYNVYDELYCDDCGFDQFMDWTDKHLND